MINVYLSKEAFHSYNEEPRGHIDRVRESFEDTFPKQDVKIHIREHGELIEADLNGERNERLEKQVDVEKELLKDDIHKPMSGGEWEQFEKIEKGFREEDWQ